MSGAASSRLTWGYSLSIRPGPSLDPTPPSLFVPEKLVFSKFVWVTRALGHFKQSFFSGFESWGRPSRNEPALHQIQDGEDAEEGQAAISTHGHPSGRLGWIRVRIRPMWREVKMIEGAHRYLDKDENCGQYSEAKCDGQLNAS
jgi:hypothetical protein